MKFNMFVNGQCVITIRHYKFFDRTSFVIIPNVAKCAFIYEHLN